MLLRMLPWAVALPRMKRTMPLPRLARLMGSTPRRERDLALERRIVRSSGWIGRRQASTNCLERALLSYRFLSKAGSDPRLVVGMARGETGMIGHAWVTVDGEPVQDSPETLDRFSRLIEFGRNGERTS